MKEDYNFKKYDYKSRWISYWHQINEALSLSPKKVLEAMACGIPVLVCNKTFEKNLVKFKDILIFQEKNPQDLAEKIINLKSAEKDKKIKKNGSGKL